jgi:hypothetical protein
MGGDPVPQSSLFLKSGKMTLITLGLAGWLEPSLPTLGAAGAGRAVPLATGARSTPGRRLRAGLSGATPHSRPDDLAT